MNRSLTSAPNEQPTVSAGLTPHQLALCEATLQAFIESERLPEAYAVTARTHFLPLLKHLWVTYQNTRKPLILGVNGCQGSGKSTLSGLLVQWFEQALGIPAVALSIDDFYLDQKDRCALAERIHPLLKTRGVPGTHNIALAKRTLSSLTSEGPPVSVPRFNKATDNPFPQSEWPSCSAPTGLCILEGWCVGSEAQSESDLEAPVNRLEQVDDPEGDWRRFANEALKGDYSDLFSHVPYWVMLKAPSFECVHQWRWQQEQKLLSRLNATGGDASGVMDESGIERFIQHYQRITEHTLQHLPQKADWVFGMDSDRQISTLKSPEGFAQHGQGELS